MSSESVKILIAADDQASAKLKEVGRQVESLGTSAKRTGRDMRASFRLAGGLAKELGLAQLSIFSGELAGASERLAGFSRLAQRGAAGAMAFKAGLVAVAGVAVYKVTQEIASWWYHLDRAKTAAKEADKAFDKTASRLESMRSKRMRQEVEGFNLIRDPKERESAIASRAEQIEKQVAKLKEDEAKARAEVAKRQREYDDAIKFEALGIGPSTEELDHAKKQLERSTQLRESIEGEAEALRELISERTKSIEARKKEKEEADRSEAYIQQLRDEVEMLGASEEERLKIEAKRNAVASQQQEAEQLLAERERLKKDEEARRQAESDRLRAEEESRRQADFIAEQKANTRTPELQALESRTLTRAPVDSVEKSILDVNKQQLEAQHQANAKLDALAEKQYQQAKSMSVELVN